MQPVPTGGSDASRPAPARSRRTSRPRRTPTASGAPRTQLTPSEIDLLESLSEAAREMHRSLSNDDVLRVATERARVLLQASQAASSRTVGQDWGQEVTFVAADRRGEAAGTPPGDWPPYALVCGANQALRLDEAGLRDHAVPGAPSRSWLAAPLVGSDGRNIGLLQVADRTDNEPFSAADEAVLVQLARLASVAIENARLYEAALDARSQLAWSAHIERVRAAELRAVIEAMGEAVLVCDARGRVRLSNPAADRLFEGRPVQSYDDLRSRFESVDDEHDGGGNDHQPAGATRRAEHRGADTDGSPELPLELRLRGRPERWLEVRVYPVGGVSGRIAEPDDGPGRICVLRDVTRARQARAQREAFLGILSHELRTPITTIYAGSKVLSRSQSTEAGTVRRELASDIAAEAERLFRLVEDLLVMTRVERGALQLASEPVLLQRVLGSAIRLEAGHWPQTRFRLRGPADMPAVAGDATYVEQVARNLLSNAAKYSPPGSTVEVQLESSDDEVIVRVLDNGPGFTSGEADDLFELFYRSPSTAAQASGAGIGLFVCRRLIMAMGGRIWATPRAAEGAEFGFALRRYREDD